jgi:hypothetical protein
MIAAASLAPQSVARTPAELGFIARLLRRIAEGRAALAADSVLQLSHSGRGFIPAKMRPMVLGLTLRRTLGRGLTSGGSVVAAAAAFFSASAAFCLRISAAAYSSCSWASCASYRAGARQSGGTVRRKRQRSRLQRLGGQLVQFDAKVILRGANFDRLAVAFQFAAEGACRLAGTVRCRASRLTDAAFCFAEVVAIGSCGASVVAREKVRDSDSLGDEAHDLALEGVFAEDHRAITASPMIIAIKSARSRWR